MKVCFAHLLFLSSILLSAQPQSSQCATLIKCKAALKAEIEANRLLTEQLNAAKAESEAKGAVVTQILDITKKYDDAIVIMETLSAQLKGQRFSEIQTKA